LDNGFISQGISKNDGGRSVISKDLLSIILIGHIVTSVKIKEPA
jgi:hypothetical protein